MIGRCRFPCSGGFGQRAEYALREVKDSVACYLSLSGEFRYDQYVYRVNGRRNYLYLEVGWRDRTVSRMRLPVLALLGNPVYWVTSVPMEG